MTPFKSRDVTRQRAVAMESAGCCDKSEHMWKKQNKTKTNKLTNIYIKSGHVTCAKLQQKRLNNEERIAM